MASALQSSERRGLIRPPGFVASNLAYECLMGSVAYGVACGDSDEDIYGFTIPPKDILFPHLQGAIRGFDDGKARNFEQYQQHHVEDRDAGRRYDFTIYNVAKFFRLAADANPNMVDTLFVPEACVKHQTGVGQLVRENRRLFLSKLAWPKFKGYAYSQVHKIRIKQPEPGGKREALVREHGYDTKFAYHCLRLLDEAEQILATGDLDIQRSREELKSIRRGEWTEARFLETFEGRLSHLEDVYRRSTLPEKPDEGAIKRLLVDALEAHYGRLSGSELATLSDAERALREIAAIVGRLGVA